MPELKIDRIVFDGFITNAPLPATELGRTLAGPFYFDSEDHAVKALLSLQIAFKLIDDDLNIWFMIDDPSVDIGFRSITIPHEIPQQATDHYIRQADAAAKMMTQLNATTVKMLEDEGCIVDMCGPDCMTVHIPSKRGTPEVAAAIIEQVNKLEPREDDNAKD